MTNEDLSRLFIIEIKGFPKSVNVVKYLLWFNHYFPQQNILSWLLLILKIYKHNWCEKNKFPRVITTCCTFVLFSILILTGGKVNQDANIIKKT
jgi:hypothetical protein